MEKEGTIAIPIIGYVIAVISPKLGLLFSILLILFKKDTPLYQKHGRYILYLAIILFIIQTIVRYLL